MSGEPLKGHLDLLLLAALRRGPAHGYAIIEELRRRSDGTFDLPEGTIYPALHRLEREGLLTSQWDVGGTQRRRIYALTAKGRQTLGEQTRIWRRFSSAVEGVMRSR